MYPPPAVPISLAEMSMLLSSQSSWPWFLRAHRAYVCGCGCEFCSRWTMICLSLENRRITWSLVRWPKVWDASPRTSSQTRSEVETRGEGKDAQGKDGEEMTCTLREQKVTDQTRTKDSLSQSWLSWLSLQWT